MECMLKRVRDAEMKALTVTIFILLVLQLLLNYNTTNSNLQGDLGNTPLILACSINNCEALSILVKTRVMFSHSCIHSVYLHQPVENNCQAICGCFLF